MDLVVHTAVQALQALPFIVGTNPFVARTLEAYISSFHWLATYPQIKSLEDNAKFTELLELLVQKHANDIPTMAKGSVYPQVFRATTYTRLAFRNVLAT